MRVIAGVATDIGRVREGNEDSYVSDAPLFAVADGMGGHRGGEVASKLALETLEHLFRRGKGGGLADQVQEANRAVFERQRFDRRVAGMGTTLTVAVHEGDRVRLAHVGDSRAYLFRGGELRLLTEDHTLVRQMMNEGEITGAEAEVHPYRSVLTRALGVDPRVAVDEGMIEVRDGDRVLLCTDGLTGMLTEDQIRAILDAAPDPQDAANRLIRAANRAGGIDNITALVLDVRTDEVGDDRAGAGGVAPQASPHPTPAPQRPRPSHFRRMSPARTAVVAGGAIAVLAVGLVGLRLYLDTQWYVGVSNGHVAEFRGIPATVGDFKLHHVVVETTLSAADAETLALYRGLPGGITAGGRKEADAIVNQIRADLARLPVGPST